jgi:hypothetical protein
VAVVATATFNGIQTSIAGAVAHYTGVSVNAGGTSRRVVLNCASSRNAGQAAINSATIDTGGGAVAMTAAQAQFAVGFEAARQFYADLPDG